MGLLSGKSFKEKAVARLPSTGRIMFLYSGTQSSRESALFGSREPVREREGMKTSSLVWRGGGLVGTAQFRRGKHLRDIWSLGGGYPKGRGNSGFRSAGGALTLGVVIRSGCGIDGEVRVEWVIPLSFLG